MVCYAISESHRKLYVLLRRRLWIPPFGGFFFCPENQTKSMVQSGSIYKCLISFFLYTSSVPENSSIHSKCWNHSEFEITRSIQLSESLEYAVHIPRVKFLNSVSRRIFHMRAVRARVRDVRWVRKGLRHEWVQYAAPGAWLGAHVQYAYSFLLHVQLTNTAALRAAASRALCGN